MPQQRPCSQKLSLLFQASILSIQNPFSEKLTYYRDVKISPFLALCIRFIRRLMTYFIVSSLSQYVYFLITEPSMLTFTKESTLHCKNRITSNIIDARNYSKGGALYLIFLSQ